MWREIHDLVIAFGECIIHSHQYIYIYMRFLQMCCLFYYTNKKGSSIKCSAVNINICRDVVINMVLFISNTGFAMGISLINKAMYLNHCIYCQNIEAAIDGTEWLNGPHFYGGVQPVMQSKKISTNKPPIVTMLPIWVLLTWNDLPAISTDMDV